MARTVAKRSPRPRVGFVGCCLPRPCGIATFTYDLARSVAAISSSPQPDVIVAVNDRSEGYNYPEKVQFEIEAENSLGYSLAAEYLNQYCSLVSLQHEFGIYGRRWGANVLHLLQNLRRPVVVTCHTVPIDPDPEQRDIFSEVVARADRLVVMNRGAIDFLQALYGARYRQIEFIGHGFHDMPFARSPRKKSRLGVKGPVLLTFGLLHSEKGLEYMVEAMGKIVRKHPDATYVVVGATHPRTVEVEGESYRKSLVGLVRRLGLEANVRLIDGFCDLNDLMAYLAETDIFVTPYLDQTRMTSGVLSYAAGAGKAIVSTPYRHAVELLAEGRGRLVPCRSVNALSRAVIDLLSDERVMAAMRRRVYHYMRGATWPAVARDYLGVFESVVANARRPAVPATLGLPLEKTQRPTVAGGPSK